MQIEVSIKYDYANELQISVSEFLSEWMFGIPLRDSLGNQLSYESIRSKILMSQTLISNLLGVKLSPTVIEESLDYIAEEFANWGHLKLNFHVKELLPGADNDPNSYLQGWYNDRKIIAYPRSWLNVSGRNLALVPGISGASAIVVSQAGSTYPTLLQGIRLIPSFFKIKYLSGLEQMPNDIKMAVGKLSAILLSSVIGDVIMPLGISSQSLSIDGLSQSVSTVMNSQGNLLSPKINLYYKELFDPNSGLINMLYNIYRGISFDTV